MIVLTLPWPPTVNTYWRCFQGRNILSIKGRQYREDAVLSIVTQNIQPIGESRISVSIDAYPPDKRKRDLDNLPKAILDALQHASVYADDSQIDLLSIYRCEHDKEDPRVVIFIVEIA